LMMRRLVLFCLWWALCFGDEWTIFSPDQSLKVVLESERGEINYKVYRKTDNKEFEEITGTSPLGLTTTTTQPTRHPQSYRPFPPSPHNIYPPTANINESYDMPHGKMLHVEAFFNHMRIAFSVNHESSLLFTLLVEFKLFNDAVAFRQTLVHTTEGSMINIRSDDSGVGIHNDAKMWGQKCDQPGWVSPAYELPYLPSRVGDSAPYAWCFPTLVQVPSTSYINTSTYILISEGGVNRKNAGTRMNPSKEKTEKREKREASSTIYFTEFATQREGNPTSPPAPSSPSPFSSPWRVLIIGDLSSVVESNAVSLVSPPLNPLFLPFEEKTGWIKPGSAAWSWYSSDTGTPELQKQFIDSASSFNWSYILIDANWNRWPDPYQQLLNLVQYGMSKSPPVGVWIWYNSGGRHNRVTEEPRDKMDVRDVRRNEMARISEIGIKGIKVDFFQSDKQQRIQQYLDILEDAAEYKLMVNFHGCTVPRGWEREYPNLMSMEAVRGGEYFKGNNKGVPASQNVIYGYTRNVVGPMDYTPLTFYSAFSTLGISYAHTLSLSVAFQSGVQHWAEDPLHPVFGFSKLFSVFPFVRDFLASLPTAWHDIKFVGGAPDLYFCVARRRDDHWWLSCISSEKVDENGIQVELNLEFLRKKRKYTIDTIKSDTQQLKAQRQRHPQPAANLREAAVLSFSSKLFVCLPSPCTFSHLLLPADGLVLHIYPNHTSNLSIKKRRPVAIVRGVENNNSNNVVKFVLLVALCVLLFLYLRSKRTTKTRNK